MVVTVRSGRLPYRAFARAALVVLSACAAPACLAAAANAPAAADPVASAPDARSLVSDPAAVRTDDDAPSPGAAGRPRARTLSSGRAHGQPRPPAPADAVPVLPAVIVPQIRLPLSPATNASGAGAAGAAPTAPVVAPPPGDVPAAPPAP